MSKVAEQPSRGRVRDRAAVALTVALLAGAAVERWTLAAPASAAAYHERVRVAGSTAPARVGRWVGRDVSVPPAAVKLLKPNLILSREFVDEAAGRRATFLLVQCDDTRELVAHYPPVCYPGQGFSLVAARPQRTRVGELDADWTQYEFARQTISQFSSTVVAHFIVMPDGRICGDMDVMRSSAARVADRFFGAAQVQVVLSGLIPAGEREAIFRELVEAHLPVINQIRSGGAK